MKDFNIDQMSLIKETCEDYRSDGVPEHLADSMDSRIQFLCDEIEGWKRVVTQLTHEKYAALVELENLKGVQS